MSHEVLKTKITGQRGSPVITVPWNVSDVVLATVLIFAGFLVVLALLRLLTDIATVEERTALTPWVIGVWEGLMVVAVWVFGVRRYRARWQALGLRRAVTGRRIALPLLALLGSLTFTGIYAAIITTLGLDALRPSPLPSEVLGEGLPKLLNAVTIVLWAPFAEEVFFRGFLLAALIPSLGALRASAVSSAVFAAAHLTLSTMIPIFATGLLFSWLYLKTRSLWQPIMAHAAQTLIAVSVIF